MQASYKTVLRTSSECFVLNVFNEKNLPDIQGKYFIFRKGECFPKKKKMFSLVY